MQATELMTPQQVTCVPETHLANGIRDLRPSSMMVADAATGAVLACGPDGEERRVLATLEATGADHAPPPDVS